MRILILMFTLSTADAAYSADRCSEIAYRFSELVDVSERTIRDEPRKLIQGLLKDDELSEQNRKAIAEQEEELMQAELKASNALIRLMRITHQHCADRWSE